MHLKKPANIKIKPNQTKPVKIIILTNTQNINKIRNASLILKYIGGKMSIHDIFIYVYIYIYNFIFSIKNILKFIVIMNIYV